MSEGSLIYQKNLQNVQQGSINYIGIGTVQPINFLHQCSQINFFAHRNSSLTFQYNYAKLLIKRSLTFDKIITVSNFSGDELQNRFHIDKSKIQVISNGVDKSLFQKEKT